MKIDKENLVRNRFWVGLGIFLPLMLIGFGLIPIAVDVFLVWALYGRRRRSNASVQA